MKTWNDLTEQEQIKMTQLITAFMDMMGINSFDPVGDVFEDVYFGVIRRSLEKITESIQKKRKHTL